MIIYLTPEQADDLKLDIYRDVVRACFYLGFNFSYTRSLVNDSTRVAERVSIVDMARSLGMSGDYILAVRLPDEEPVRIKKGANPHDQH
jgi:hypothetical protein